MSPSIICNPEVSFVSVVFICLFFGISGPLNDISVEEVFLTLGFDSVFDFDLIIFSSGSFVISGSSMSSSIIKSYDFFFIDFFIFFILLVSGSTTLSIKVSSASIPSTTTGYDSNSEFFETFTTGTD